VGSELRAFLVLLLLSLAVPIALFLLLRTSLRELLQQTVKSDAGVTFYLLSFLLTLFLAALSSVAGTSSAVGPAFMLSDPRATDYVWREGLSRTLEKTLWVTVVYAVLITILVATSKVKEDK
jgi:hypothetical protein